MAVAVTLWPRNEQVFTVIEAFLLCGVDINRTATDCALVLQMTQQVEFEVAQLIRLVPGRGGTSLQSRGCTSSGVMRTINSCSEEAHNSEPNNRPMPGRSHSAGGPFDAAPKLF